MATITRMRDVILSIDGRKVALCQKAEIRREWECIHYPIYRDSPVTKTLRTLERIRITLERIFQVNDDFFDVIDDTGLSFVLTTDEETHTVSGGQIIDYQLEGGPDGELIERVTLTAETYS